MKKKKQNVIIIRVTDSEKEMVDKMRKENAINISSLVRKLIREHYEKKSNCEK